jgi:hypothetical protein
MMEIISIRVVVFEECLVNSYNSIQHFTITVVSSRCSVQISTRYFFWAGVSWCGTHLVAIFLARFLSEAFLWPNNWYLMFRLILKYSSYGLQVEALSFSLWKSSVEVWGLPFRGTSSLLKQLQSLNSL